MLGTGPAYDLVVRAAVRVFGVAADHPQVPGEAPHHFVGEDAGWSHASGSGAPRFTVDRYMGAGLWARPPKDFTVRLFGTNGIREVVGTDLTATFVTRVAGAIAAQFAPGKPILVGMDGRTSSPAFARIVSGTLALAGHDVLEIGILPTPAIQYNVTRLNAQLAVIVTASHNPREFNGVKCIAADGLEISRATEQAIEAAVEADRFTSVPYDRVGDITPQSDGARRYVEGILGQVDVAKIRARKFTVALDCGNGASVPTSPTLLRKLGCRVLTLNGHVDGTFPGHLSEPTEENLVDLRKMVPAVGADLGIAHDGDADRAVFVDATGRYVPGEEILTLLGEDAVRRHKGGVVVTPVSASQSLEDVVTAAGGSVVYTRIGSPVVTHELETRHGIFGGEENGGLIFPEFQLARDGGMTAAATLDLLARRGVGLIEALAPLPKYALVKVKEPVPAGIREPVIARVAETLKAGSDRLVTIDGVKSFRDGGWVLVRASGTEPLFRIFAESKDRAQARALAQLGVDALRAAVAEIGGSERPSHAGRPAH
jgi:phosphomannomutase/phosphoglucomutase